MVRAYSQDLRERVVRAYEAEEGGYGTLGRRFQVAPGTVRRWVHIFHREGRLAPKPYRHGFPSVLEENDAAVLRQLVAEQNDATLADYAARFTARTGSAISPSSVGRVLRRRRLFRKKKTRRASEQHRPDVAAERAAFRRRMAAVDPRRWVFLDETGAQTNMTRTYARASGAQRAIGVVPRQSQRVTVLGALSLAGVAGPLMPSTTATNVAVFTRYLSDDLLPFLKEHHPDAILVMDNLPVHHAPQVRQTLTEAGIAVQYLPRYSPELSPIEECWSKLKEYLRAAAARTTEAVIQALDAAVATVTRDDIRGWFEHSGYPSAGSAPLPLQTR